MSHISSSSQNPSSNIPQAAAPKPFRFDVPSPHRRHIERFQALYQQRFGVRLGEVDAAGKLTAILVLVRYRRQEETISRILQSPRPPAKS